MKEQVEDIVYDVIGNNAQVHQSKRGNLSMQWPTRDSTPLSELSTQYFFTLAFPNLFPSAAVNTLSTGRAPYHLFLIGLNIYLV